MKCVNKVSAVLDIDTSLVHGDVYEYIQRYEILKNSYIVQTYIVLLLKNFSFIDSKVFIMFYLVLSIDVYLYSNVKGACNRY